MWILLFTLILTGCNDQIRSRHIDGAVMNGDIRKSPIPENTKPVQNPTPATPAKPTLHPRCQSEQRCLYARMPVYQQDSDDLESYLSSLLHIPGYQDPGLCVPTSATMILRAVLDERNYETVLNNSFLSGVQSKPWTQTLYRIGTDSGTDFVYGGAPIDGVEQAFKTYFAQTMPKKNLLHFSEGTVGSRSTLSGQEIIGLIRTQKFAFLISVHFSLPKVNNQNQRWYEALNGGHALVIKGFDGDRLHLQDPWGMDYFVRINTEQVAHTSFGIKEKTSVFLPLSSAGSMGSFGGSHKISLQEIYGLTLD